MGPQCLDPRLRHLPGPRQLEGLEREVQTFGVRVECAHEQAVVDLWPQPLRPSLRPHRAPEGCVVPVGTRRSSEEESGRVDGPGEGRRVPGDRGRVGGCHPWSYRKTIYGAHTHWGI